MELRCLRRPASTSSGRSPTTGPGTAPARPRGSTGARWSSTTRSRDRPFSLRFRPPPTGLAPMPAGRRRAALPPAEDHRFRPPALPTPGALRPWDAVQRSPSHRGRKADPRCPDRRVRAAPGGTGGSARVSTARTGRDGVFAIGISPGPSREIVAAFGGTRVLGRSAARPLRFGVRSSVRLGASSGAANVGGRPVVFTGGVAAPRAAAARREVDVLQFSGPGPDLERVPDGETNRRGRFRFAYRFSDNDSRGARFQFRAYARAERLAVRAGELAAGRRARALTFYVPAGLNGSERRAARRPGQPGPGRGWTARQPLGGRAARPRLGCA